MLPKHLEVDMMVFTNNIIHLKMAWLRSVGVGKGLRFVIIVIIVSLVCFLLSLNKVLSSCPFDLGWKFQLSLAFQTTKSFLDSQCLRINGASAAPWRSRRESPGGQIPLC